MNINNKWDDFLNEEFNKDYFIKLSEFLNNEYEEKTIFPPKKLIFNAFNLTPLNSIKVVILGQDPYIKEGQAHGLSFSVCDGVRIPPSLRNIYKEQMKDVHISMPDSGNLIPWATQGVFLLNTILTVESGKSNSHKNKGWEIFTDNIIKHLSKNNDNLVFMLWGNNAIKKKHIISNENNLILTAPHPSPLARGGFFGCKHFSLCNDFLKKNGINPIDWQI